MQAGNAKIQAQFTAPHPELRRYITTYYIADVESTNGDLLEDLIHPEWGSVRFLCRGAVSGNIISVPAEAMPPVTLVGPTSQAASVACTSMRVASFGLLPLGWRRFVGESAHLMANRSVEAHGTTNMARFVKLLPKVTAATGLSEVAAIFDSALLDALQATKRDREDDETTIERVHRSLADPDITSVAELAAKVGLTTSQLERLSKRVFGFSPKLLLQRQRFLRTLAMVLREPTSRWGEILDPQYHDQAHFNRDFRRFFGMSPKQYLKLPRPIVTVAARERMRAMGNPLQGLQLPGGEEPGIAKAE